MATNAVIAVAVSVGTVPKLAKESLFVVQETNNVANAIAVKKSFSFCLNFNCFK